MTLERFIWTIIVFFLAGILVIVIGNLPKHEESGRSPLLDLTEVIRPEPGIVCVVIKVSVNYSVSCLKEEKVLEQL